MNLRKILQFSRNLFLYSTALLCCLTLVRLQYSTTTINHSLHNFDNDKEQFSQKEGTIKSKAQLTPIKSIYSDYIISVKTSAKFHDTRLKLALDTWYKLAPTKTFFFTDTQNDTINAAIGGRLIATTCSASHHRTALCCKMNAELDHYYRSNASWFCHFDDDNYVNVPALEILLKEHDSSKDWYLGKPSTNRPIRAQDRLTKGDLGFTEFWFATGGAGVCLSRSLTTKMRPYVQNGKFTELGNRIRLPDDVTLGYLIEYLIGVNLTKVPEFHSHLESMSVIKTQKLHQQISVSYSNNRMGNLVSIYGPFSSKDDPTRLKNVHCWLFPNDPLCYQASIDSPHNNYDNPTRSKIKARNLLRI